jgi:1-phosphofructokinase family hexose kinase
MILTVTPNPAFDRVQTVPAFQPGRVCRSTALTLSAAGKGINVARAIRSLGGESMCAGFLGGHTGRMLAEFATRDRIPAQWTWIDGETRVTVIILAPETGTTTVLNEEGPSVNIRDWNRLQTDILASAAKAQAVCLSGSLPLGVPPEVMGTLIHALNLAQRRVFVDQSGKLLQIAVAAKPEVVKINNTEAAALLGCPEFDDPDSAARAAKAIRQNGVSKVIITLGAQGAVLAGHAGCWLATPPPLKIVSPIGSGDSFLAGLTLSMLQDLPDPEALRRAVAAGSANALSAAGGSFSPSDYDRILALTTVKPLA